MATDVISLAEQRKDEVDQASSFQQLYQRYQGMIRGILYNMCGPRYLDDLVQETFMRIWRGIDQFKHRSQLKTWIYRVTVNTGLDHCRKNAKRHELALLEDVPSPATAPGTIASQELIQKGLQQLSPKHRAVLILSCFEERPMREIATIIKKSEGTVKSRLHYAKQAMRDFLKTNGVTL